MTVFFGIPDPLRNLRRPLQEFVRDRILRGDEPTEENMDRAVDTLLEDAATDITQICVRTLAGCKPTTFTYSFIVFSLTSLIHLDVQCC